MTANPQGPAPAVGGEGQRRNRALFLVIVLVVAACLVLVGTLFWIQQLGPVPPPTNDVHPPEVIWIKDPARPGEELRDAGPIVGLAFRVMPRSFDPPADRLYVTTPTRVYALKTGEESQGLNAWGTLQYFNITSDAASRVVSLPPVAMNYGDYVSDRADYEVYVGTSDGRLLILRDLGNYVPSGNAVAVMNLTGAITGLAAYVGDIQAPAAIVGNPNYLHRNAGAWIDESVSPASGDVGEYTSLGLNSAGDAFVASYDVATGRPVVTMWTPSGRSTLLSLEPFSPTRNVGFDTSVAVGSDGRPRVAYYDQTDGDLRYATWDGLAWTVVDVDAVADVGASSSLKLDGLDRPHIAYYNRTGGHLQYAHFDGVVWTIEVPDASSNDTGRSASLALDGLGNPRIAYYDATARALRFVAKNGGTWLPRETVDTGTDDVGSYVSLAVDPATSRPHVAYYDATARGLRYASNASAWTSSFVDTRSDVDLGRYPSIALGVGGSPAIAYHDATGLDLKYATWTGAVWNVQTLRTRGNVGLYNSLAFDGLGQPHIAYYSFETGRTEKDLLAAGASAGDVYGIDVSLPRTIERLFREKHVKAWDYRIRWVAREGTEAHLADAPQLPSAPAPMFSPAFDVNGTRVFVGLQSGEVIAFNTTNGAVVWRRTIPGAPWESAPITLSNLSPGAEWVLAAGSDGTLSVFDAGTGGLVGAARVASGALRTPTVDGTRAYVASSAGEFVAVRLGDPGAQDFLTNAWTTRLAGPGSGSVAVVPRLSLELVADETGRLHGFRADGTLSYRAHLCDEITAGPAVWHPPFPAIQPVAWIGCRDGTVMEVSTTPGPP